MPKEVQHLKEFIDFLKKYNGKEDTDKKGANGDSKKHHPKHRFQNKITIKYGSKGSYTKFKLRTSKYLITFKTKVEKTAARIMETLSPSIEKTIISKKNDKKRKK